jgi:hypothetical protein
MMVGELIDHELYDILDINSLPIELLSSFRFLGLGGAARLHRFVQDKFLRPLAVRLLFPLWLPVRRQPARLPFQRLSRVFPVLFASSGAAALTRPFVDQ